MTTHIIHPRNRIVIRFKSGAASPYNCHYILISKLSAYNAAIFSIPVKLPNVAPDSRVFHLHASSIRDWGVG